MVAIKTDGLNKFQKGIITLSVIIILIKLILNSMNSISDINSLNKKISLTEVITIVALGITLVSAIFAFYFKGRQNNLLKIQREDDQLKIAESNALAESANRDASLASERAEMAIKDAALANKEAARFMEEAAKLNKKAADAELRSKELEVKLLELRLAVGDRYLPDNIVKILRAKLKNFPNKRVLIYCSVFNDSEPLDFSNKLNDFFNSIGWNSNVVSQNNVMIPAPTGISITAIGELNKKIVEILFDQFNSLNYKCSVDSRNGNSPDLIINVFAH